jgi:two-component system chemotaxis response regulator CheY
MAYRILIVDDSATMRAMIRRTIGLAGLEVEAFFEAGHGMDALELLRREKVDLVLADLHMPVMNGVELSRAVLADPALSAVRLAVISAEPSADK